MDIRLSKYATCMHPIESGIMCMPLDKLVNTDHIFQLANVLWHNIITVGKTSYYTLANKTSNSYPSRLTHISTWMIRISEMAWHWWLDLQYGVYQEVTWPSDVTWESSIDSDSGECFVDFEAAGVSESRRTLECFRQPILSTEWVDLSLQASVRVPRPTVERHPDMVAAIHWDLSRIH